MNRVNFIRDFPLGPVNFFLALLMLLSGAALLTIARPSPRPDFDMWVFASTHGDEYASRARTAPPAWGSIRVQNLGVAENERLSLGMLANEQLPDLFELEDNYVTYFFRGDDRAVPLLDLAPLLKRDGLLDQLVPARLTKYTKSGRIYGIPHDLHPVVLAYRADLLAQAGVDPESIQTWDDLAALAPKLSRGGRIGERDWRYTLALPSTYATYFMILLWQRGGGVFDEHNRVTLDNDLAIDTLERYMRFFEGDPPLAAPLLVRPNEDERALADGHFVMLMAADWALGLYKRNQADILRGKLRIMPLPAWERGGRRTSSFGGTVLALPKQQRDLEATWRLAKYFYFEGDAFVGRYRKTMIVTPMLSAHHHPVFDEPDDFFGGQRVGRVLADLAADVPPIFGGPYLQLLRGPLGDTFPEIMARRLSPRDGLHIAADRLRRMIARYDMIETGGNGAYTPLGAPP